jgi:hypothetical protein
VTAARLVQGTRPRTGSGGVLCIALVAAAALVGCGGGAPLLHPAHVLHPGEILTGAGLSGQVAFGQVPPGAPQVQQNWGSLEALALSPGVAPWAAARVGLPDFYEAGLTYAGRSIRVDARHAFAIGPGGKAALSIGLGASVLAPKLPGGGNPTGVLGGGGDLPILIGWRSAADIFSFWFGPRAGFEVFTGQVQMSDFSGGNPLFDITGHQFYAGLTAGARVGFRHVHLALELNASYHAASGSFTLAVPDGNAMAGTTPGAVQQLSLTPAGALEVSF